MVAGGLNSRITDARRNFAGDCGRWYRVILTLHRFFMQSPSRWSVMWMETVLRLGRWSGLLVLSLKRRQEVHAVRDRAF